MFIQHEERVTPWEQFGHNGYARVRIWQRLTLFGMYQRHEWESDAGERSVDRWIPGTRHWCEGAAVTSECLPSETDLLLDAVRSIAKGHNDARGLAVETLQLIGDKQ